MNRRVHIPYRPTHTKESLKTNPKTESKSNPTPLTYEEQQKRYEEKQKRLKDAEEEKERLIEQLISSLFQPALESHSKICNISKAIKKKKENPEIHYFDQEFREIGDEYQKFNTSFETILDVLGKEALTTYAKLFQYNRQLELTMNLNEKIETFSQEILNEKTNNPLSLLMDDNDEEDYKNDISKIQTIEAELQIVKTEIQNKNINERFFFMSKILQKFRIEASPS